MFRASCLAFGLLLLSSPAFAHIDLVFPPPRLAGTTGGNALKVAPCGQPMGQNGRTTTVTEFAPGETIIIALDEYIPHPGYYRVAFDIDGDDDFPIRDQMDSVKRETDDPEQVHPVGDVVLLYEFDKNSTVEGPLPEGAVPANTLLEVTLPNVECDNCTLQVIQFMYDKTGNGSDDEYYFQCADLRLVGDVANVDPDPDSDEPTTEDPGLDESNDVTDESTGETADVTDDATGSELTTETSDDTSSVDTVAPEDPFVPSPPATVSPNTGGLPGGDTTATPGTTDTTNSTSTSPTAPTTPPAASSGTPGLPVPSTSAPQPSPSTTTTADTTTAPSMSSSDSGCAVKRPGANSRTGGLALLFASIPFLAAMWARRRPKA